ncbi:hypothetical protein [Pseudoalteromonas luteoviolacea]|uniref:Uncharacterized protein n=1 Tax=Pseudoalteromonas luteoviolacea DSM 6061 TaxID=1365250 RepID=A0A166X4L3_9GAMM|nr:hypothetical protein [Pseudoalteromonas luteoviolacea]KZN39597.1 hypothetical protein N475_14370 [Pseudoalteromonas luteoviolacea DSM 6061]
MFRQLCLIIGAFCLGVVVTHSYHHQPFKEPPADFKDTNNQMTQARLDDNFNASELSAPHDTQAHIDGDELTSGDDMLLALEQENEQLRVQIAQLQQQTLRAKATGNVAKQLQSIFEHQQRDEVWASEVEIQAADFLYVSALQDLVSMPVAQCKEDVCQLNFQAIQREDGNKHWQHVHNALIKMPWMRQFKTITAVQNGPSMQVHLSLKRSGELKPVY